MKVSVLKGYEQPEKRSFKGQNGKPDVDRFTQRAFIHVGAPFPIEFTVNLDSLAHAYAVGEYELDASCFEVGKFGKLEINPYKISLTPVAQTLSKVG